MYAVGSKTASFSCETEKSQSCLISPSRMVSFSSPPDDEMYLEQCNQRTVKISVEFRQINYAVYVEVQLIFIHNLNFIFLCFWVWYVRIRYRN